MDWGTIQGARIATPIATNIAMNASARRNNSMDVFLNLYINYVTIQLRLLSDGYSGSDIKPIKEYNQKKSFRKYLHTDEIIAVTGEQN